MAFLIRPAVLGISAAIDPPNGMIMACGKEYTVATEGTISKDFKLHMNREDPNCKMLLKIHTKRQNRQDVYLDGVLQLATNAQLEADGSISFSIAAAGHIPTVDSPVGTNEMLYLVVGGSTVSEVIVAKTLIVEFQSTALELTPEELYSSDLLIN